MSSQPSKKRSRKNQHQRDKKKKKRDKANVKALALSTHAVFSGKIVNNRCILRLNIRRPGSTGSPSGIDAVIDTGATILAIRSDVARDLRLPVIGPMRTNTPTGSEQCNAVAAELLLHSQNRTINMVRQAVVYDNMIVPMLFGMKEMVGGVLRVDMNAGVWELRYK